MWHRCLYDREKMIRKYHFLSFFGNRVSFFVIFCRHVFLFLFFFSFFEGAVAGQLAKWLSVRLWTKWLWVRVQLQSFKLQISRLLRARSFLTFRLLCSFFSNTLTIISRQDSCFSGTSVVVSVCVFCFVLFWGRFGFISESYQFYIYIK